MKIDWNYRDISIHKVENGFLLGKRSRGYCDISQDEAFFATAAELVLAILKIEDEKTGEILYSMEDASELIMGMGALHAELMIRKEEKKEREAAL